MALVPKWCEGQETTRLTSQKDHDVKRWQMVVVALLLVSSGLVSRGVSRAERARPIRIGALTMSWGPTSMIVGFRDGLVELGYRNNEDFFLGVRFTQGDITALPAAARELVQSGVDLIFANENEAAKAAQRATARIPIVFAGVEDPVGAGLIQSFAQPGGNLTGVTNLDIELGPKRLEVFQQVVPGLKRVLFLYNVANVSAREAAKVYREAARRLGMVWVEWAVRTQEEAQTALSQVRQNEGDGILAPRCCDLNIPGLVLEVATQQGLPTMFDTAAFWMEHGALASYGPDSYESGRQAARLVDKILKGADPAKLPAEANSNIQFAINLKTAKTLGLTIDPEVLYQADRIIR